MGAHRRYRLSRRQGLAILAAGLVMIVAAPLVWWLSRPTAAGQTVDTVGADAAAALTSSLPPTPSGASGGSDVGTLGTSIGGSVGGVIPQWAATAAGAAPGPAAEPPAESATTAPPATEPPAVEPAAAEAPATEPPAAAPARLTIPAIDVDSAVIDVGVDSRGRMEIPPDVQTIGWYRFGPAPGATAGSAVLTGHVDDYRQGAGAFKRLGDLTIGDLISVTDTAGTARTFAVVAREQWSKGAVPLDRLFDRGGSPRMVLVTCGGSFNTETLGYDDNIAVTATPVLG